MSLQENFRSATTLWGMVSKNFRSGGRESPWIRVNCRCGRIQGTHVPRSETLADATTAPTS